MPYTYSKLFSSLCRNDGKMLWAEEHIIKTNLTFLENCVLAIEDKLKNSDNFNASDKCKSVIDSKERLECYCGTIDFISEKRITTKIESKDLQFSFQSV